MEKLTILNALKNKGYKYNPETGVITLNNKQILNRKSTGYLRLCINIDGKQYHTLQHHYAWFIYYGELNIIPYEQEVDHINRNKSDNRICNLRLTDRTTNVNNSDYVANSKGYYWCKKKKRYVAQIGINGKKIHIGYFNTPEEAHQVYLNTKKNIR